MDQLLSKVMVLELSHGALKCLCKPLVCVSVATWPCLTFLHTYCV